MTAWIVTEGEGRPYDPTDLPDRDRYGWDWLYVEAATADDALAQAAAWDAGTAPTEVALFTAAYRAGALLLPGDEWVGIDDIAQRAGVRRTTVDKWRQRHPAFPPPLDERPPRWAWSDVAAWLRIPRPVGRPKG